MSKNFEQLASENDAIEELAGELYQAAYGGKGRCLWDAHHDIDGATSLSERNAWRAAARRAESVFGRSALDLPQFAHHKDRYKPKEAKAATDAGSATSEPKAEQPKDAKAYAITVTVFTNGSTITAQRIDRTDSWTVSWEGVAVTTKAASAAEAVVRFLESRYQVRVLEVQKV